MAPYHLQFVDSIATTPTIRLDLTLPPWSVQAGTEFPPPELRRAAVSTLLADGERYPAAAYRNRTLTLEIRVESLGDDATATALQSLYRELDRPCNILRYQPGTSAPVFFRTFRCPPSEVVWDPVDKRVVVKIPAEPFAYGAKETVGPVTVNNNPASTNGLYLDLPAVKGDVETPLRMTMPVAVNLTIDGMISLFAVRRRGTPSAAPFLLQAEAMTVGTDTTLQANSATMSGSGQNYIRTTFTSLSTLSQRAIMSTWPAVDSVDVRGRYRVYANVKKSVAGDAIDVQMRWGYAGTPGQIVGPTVRLGAHTDRHLVDLGLISYPAGPDPVVDGFSGAPLLVSGQAFALHASRTGSGTLDWDYVVFVPADDRVCLVDWGNSQRGAGESVVVDGTTETVYPVTSTGVVYGGPPSAVAGGFVAVSPGVTNRVYFIRSVGPFDQLADTTAITVDYWPRYLYVRPVAS